MKNFCENIANDFIPSIRALITRELVERYGLTQKKAADLLEITQPAVSQYLKEARASKAKNFAKNKELMKMIEELAFRIYNNDIKSSEISKNICKICEKYRNNKDECILSDLS
ncbi:MAG: hypothetical protein QXM68_02495 [Candidatus Aenigmatarchaeota archaeon]|nr:hypothetical protein [Candidatus Aenigmarchaeota archaeon]